MRYEAFAHRGFQERGMTHIVATRTDDAGWLQASVFLLDLWCLGVKDAFVTEMPAIDWPHHLNRIIPGERIAIHPACARKLVEGAVAYAESLGFGPHRDFKPARRAFGSVKAADCPETFTYGRDGKPLFVAGPDDDDERIDRIMRTLTAKLGSNGFHYILPAGLVRDAGEPDELDEEAADVDPTASEELSDLFASMNRRSDFDALGGLCAALAVCDAEVAPEDIVADLWEGIPPKTWSKDEASHLPDLIAEFWNETEDRLDLAEEQGAPETIPHFVDEALESDPEYRARARTWCCGFVRAVRAWPEAWGGALERADLKPHFDTIAALAGLGEESPDAEILADAALAERIGAALLALRAGLAPRRSDDTPAAGD